MKTLFSVLMGMLLCVAVSCPVLADELKVSINVENGEKETQVVGASVYALVDVKLTEITVAPDDMAFKMNGKFGALRIKSFWLSNGKLKKINTPEKAEE